MYYIIYGFLYLISLLPLRVLYFISDGLYVLIYYVFGYRKKVVFKNLNIAFPEKSEKEKIRIAKNFYHKFIDSLLEMLKLLSASDAFFRKRFVGNWDELIQHYAAGRAVQLHMGHNFNWEWGNIGTALNTKFQVLGVYMPIGNKHFDRLFLKMRMRNGTRMLSAHRMSREFLPFKDMQYCLGLVADQSPGGKLQTAKWYPFFNHLTAFTVGPAKNAIAHNTVVILGFINRVKRGHYQIVYETLTTEPKKYSVDTLTYHYVQYLENVIRQYPDMWLWSHNRFKHQWQEGYTLGEIPESKIL